MLPLLKNDFYEKPNANLFYSVNESLDNTLIKKDVDTIYQKSRHDTETEEQKAIRREKAKLRARRIRAAESEEARAKRRQIAKERKRMERANETEEQAARRREIARQRVRLIRAMETEEEKERRRFQARERIRLKRALELEEDKIRKREVARERARRLRALETEEQREKRNKKGRERMRRKRALELLRSYGYTDEQLLVYNHYLQTLAQQTGCDSDENSFDYIRIKEYLMGGANFIQPEYQQEYIQYECSRTEKSLQNLEIQPNEAGTSKDNMINNPSKSLDNRLDPPFQGKRIIDIKYFFEQLQIIALHNFKICNFNSLQLVSECADGLCSELTLTCKNCGADFTIALNDNSNSSDLNISAVFGAEQLRIGFLGLKRICDSVGMLSMSEDKYNEIENITEVHKSDTVVVKQENCPNNEISNIQFLS